MKKLKLVNIVVIIIAIIIFSIPTSIYARPDEERAQQDAEKVARDQAVGTIDTNFYEPGQLTGYQQTYQKAGKVLAVIRSVGIIAAVIVLMVLGIKYMIGSAEQRAEYKKSMIPYVIGVVLIVSIIGILSLINELTNSVTDANPGTVTSTPVEVVKPSETEKTKETRTEIQ